jgi:small subunit ribosomal protein S20
MAEEEKKEKVEIQRRPQALKRDIQNAKRQQHNRAFRSKANTAIRALRTAVSSGQKEAAKLHLNQVYSIMDKGVKTGIVKKNKAARVKARLTAKV